MSILVLALPVAIVAAVAGALISGTYRWQSETRGLRAGLDAARLPVEPRIVEFQELDGLPAPVQRFFRAVLTEGQPMIAGVRLRHTGTFNMGEATDQWKPFTSDQQVVTRRPGFDWDARIAMMPGVPIRVHDSYVAGEGRVHASLAGLFSVADAGGSEAMAEGELMRYLAEATWYPTVLLPSQGVRWEAVDDRSADVALTEGTVSVTLRVSFGDSGAIETVRSAARGRMVNGTMVPTPWLGRFWNYGERDGMRVPADGEVAWVLPTGPRPVPGAVTSPG